MEAETNKQINTSSTGTIRRMSKGKDIQTQGERSVSNSEYMKQDKNCETDGKAPQWSMK
jgi:hypothetical protein